VILHLFAGVERLGASAPVAFIVLYAVAVVAFVPGSPLTLLGGAIFGLWRGLLFSFVGATLGSTIAFLIGRYVARGAVARRLVDLPRIAAIDRAVAADGRRIVFLLRLSPIVPFNILNYTLGLSRISVWDFLAASAGMLPGGLVFAYAGKVSGEALAVAGQAQVAKDASYYAMLIGGLAATLAATYVVSRAARTALSDV
jgi:uncharacterized membrane protein YdjX (TVP38/TMEM64 family)